MTPSRRHPKWHKKPPAPPSTPPSTGGAESSGWRVKTSAEFDDDLRRLDREIARRVMRYLFALRDLEDPRQRGKALTGPLVGTWRYRVGDYRVLARIEHDTVTILALSVGHRSSVYGG